MYKYISPIIALLLFPILYINVYSWQPPNNIKQLDKNQDTNAVNYNFIDIGINMVDKNSTQTIRGHKTFTGTVTFVSTPTMSAVVSTAVYANNSGLLDNQNSSHYATAGGLNTEIANRIAGDVALGISTGNIVASIQNDYVNVKQYGAMGDNSTDDTTAIRNAILACGTTQTLFIPDGIYLVNSTTNTFALTVACSIQGSSPKNAVIKNIGTGSGLLIKGAGYYSKWSNFQVMGSTMSQDGIVTSSDSANGTSYSSFESVWATYNGRHGLVHRMSWGTRYIDCKFQYNEGLGFYAYRKDGDFGGNTSISCINCDARWNGGTGDATNDLSRGGVRIGEDLVSFGWYRGVIESNNAWGVIISSRTDKVCEQIMFDGVHMENEPPLESDSTVGGHFFASGDWENLTIQNCWISYGAKLGATGYAYYITSMATPPPSYPTTSRMFYHRNNWNNPSGAGTRTLWYKNGNFIENDDIANNLSTTYGVTSATAVFSTSVTSPRGNFSDDLNVGGSTQPYKLSVYQASTGLSGLFDTGSTSNFLDLSADEGSGSGNSVNLGFYSNTAGGRVGYWKYNLLTDVLSARVDGTERFTMSNSSATYFVPVNISTIAVTMIQFPDNTVITSTSTLGGGGSPDLSNYAALNSSPTWTGSHTFIQDVVAQSTVTVNGDLVISTNGIIRSGLTEVLRADPAKNNLFIGRQDTGNPYPTGQFNIGIGFNNLNSLYSGSANTVVGYQTMRNSKSESNNNTAVGYKSLYGGSGGIVENTAIGGLSLYALIGNTVSSYGIRNTAVGYGSAPYLTLGSRNLILGWYADVPSATGDYQMSIGNLIYGTGVDGYYDIVSTGKVGIGKTVPTTKFEVADGSITISGSNANLIVGGTSNVTGTTIISTMTATGNANFTNTTSTITVSGFLKARIIEGSSLPTTGYGRGTFFFNTATGVMNVSSETVVGIESWKSLW